MKLYGIPLSVHTRKVQLGLRTKGLDHDLRVVVPIAPDTLPDNWQTLSPTGMIPVLQDGSFILPDSAAILQYLDMKYPRTPVIPTNPEQRGRAIWFEAYLGGFFRDVLHPLFHQRVAAPMQGMTPDADLIERVLSERAPRFFAYLEGQINGDWLVGDSFSIADIAVIANLILLEYLGETVPAARYPALSAYFRRLLNMPAVIAQLADEKPFTEQMGFSQESVVV
jgi:glutathione S-transferase